MPKLMRALVLGAMLAVLQLGDGRRRPATRPP